MVSNTSESREHLSKITKTCKLLGKLCKTAFFIFILWSACAVLIMFSSVFTSGIPLETLPLAIIAPVVFLLYSANAALLPWILGEMLSDISEDQTPFTLQNANRLRVLAIILLLYTFLEWLVAITDSQFAVLIEGSLFTVSDIATSFSSEVGTTFNLFPLVIAAVFFALSYVFKYGVLLQQESDETL